MLHVLPVCCSDAIRPRVVTVIPAILVLLCTWYCSTSRVTTTRVACMLLYRLVLGLVAMQDFNPYACSATARTW